MFANSVIFNFIYRILMSLKTWYAESKTSAILKSFCSGAARVFGASAILNFLSRDGWLVRVWENSAVYRFFEGVINLPVLLHKLYLKCEAVLKGSVLFKLVLAMADKLNIFVALFLVVALAVPDRKWYNIYSTAAAACLLLLYIIRQAADGRKFKGLKYFNIYFAIYVVCIIFADFTSIFPSQSMRFLVFFMTCFAIMVLLAVSIRTPQELYETVGTIMLGLLACGAYGVLQIIRGVPVIPSQVDITLNDSLPGRVFSTMGNANNYAQILCMLLPFCIAMFLNSRYAISRLFFAAIALPAFATLLYTSSRSGWIGFAVSMLVFVFLINKKILPVLIAGGLLCIPIMPDFVYRRLTTITNLSDSSIGYRFKIWRISFKVLHDYLVTGLGLGTDAFVSITRNYYLGETNGLTPPHSHNLYLQMWLETGIIGILSFIAFMLRLVKQSYKSIAKSTDKRLRNVLAAGISSLAGISVIGLFEYVWYYPRVMLFFWVVAGISVAVLQLMGREESREEKNAAVRI